MAKSKIIASVLFSVLFMLPSVMVEAAGPKLKLTRKSTEAKAKAALGKTRPCGRWWR